MHTHSHSYERKKKSISASVSLSSCLFLFVCLSLFLQPINPSSVENFDKGVEENIFFQMKSQARVFSCYSCESMLLGLTFKPLLGQTQFGCQISEEKERKENGLGG